LKFLLVSEGPEQYLFVSLLPKSRAPLALDDMGCHLVLRANSNRVAKWVAKPIIGNVLPL
jgi:hypothetical protein